MNKFRNIFERLITLNFFFQEILNGFYVVVGGALDIFHTLSIFKAEVIDNLVEQVIGVRIKRRYFCNFRICCQCL